MELGHTLDSHKDSAIITRLNIKLIVEVTPLKTTRLLKFAFLILSAATISACGAAGETATQEPSPTATSQPEPTLEPTATPTQAGPSFEALAYRDENAGFELEYPASWTLDESGAQGGDRGYYVQFSSWAHAPGDIEEVPTGESILTVSVLLWEPLDLDAYMEVRRQAWDVSGMTILSEEEVQLAGNLRAFKVLIQAQDQQSIFVTTLLGERFLVLSGSGDLDLLSEIALTLRPLN